METKKITVNMLSKADSVAGQGVGSAYLEQVRLVKESNLLNITINKKTNKEIDLIHVHSINPSFYFRLHKKVPSICYVHLLPETLDGSIKLPKLFFAIFKKYVISFYRKADYIVVVNPIFIEPLVNKYKIKKERIKYIPNYVDSSTVYEIADKETLREKYGYNPNDFIVLGVGQIQHRKGVLDFIETALKTPDVKYIWCGGFSFKKISDGYKELKDIVDNPPANVSFLGIIPREKMCELYNIANLLFLPSYNELFPMCILEAIQINKPILLRNLDLYEPILFGHYQKGSDNDQFKEKILKLKDDQEYLTKAMEDSKWLKDHYSKESILKIWEDFYFDVYKNSLEEVKK